MNLRDENGFTPLSVACKHGYKKIIQILLEDTTKVNANTKIESHYCKKHLLKKRCDSVHILQRQKADVNIRSNDGFSPLYIACEKNFMRLYNI